ncbi:hypothetical protein OUZ56_011115 [Daphnia magna]|uniref:Uncharacterized protein n=1 Tax=Daphnia magna TaxID=35525 RepID=A0ABQ9YZA4_9CRUS|nr:hypothetical protein OUZ56_011115 [Daphnia magna]
MHEILCQCNINTRLAQSVEHETLNLRVVGSSPTLGAVLSQLSTSFVEGAKNSTEFFKRGRNEVYIARLAQLVERGTFNPEVKGSSPLSGETFFTFFTKTVGSSLLAEEFRLLPEIRLLQGDEQQTIHKQ